MQSHSSQMLELSEINSKASKVDPRNEQAASKSKRAAAVEDWEIFLGLLGPSHYHQMIK